MAGQGSARVTLREIDLSQVRNPQQLPQGVPAAVVGTARKGPAFVPQTFANMQQFNEVFGSMLEVGREGNSNLPGPLALNEWMQSAQAGTFLRVLGVGDGKKADTNGKVTDAGFIVGDKQVQIKADGTASKVGNNPHATIGSANGDDTAAVAVARTHFLGCFMKDVEGSRFLCDSDVQKETSSAVLDFIEFDNAAHNSNNTLQLFLPKEVVNSVATAKVTEDVTITIELKTALTANVANIANNTVEVLANDNDINTLNDNFVEAMLSDVAVNTQKTDDSDYKFKSLSVNLSEIFSAITKPNTVRAKLTLASTRKEGNQVHIVQTSGTAEHIKLGPSAVTELNKKVFFAGAHLAAPVIRGVLMAPQGIKPAIDIDEAKLGATGSPNILTSSTIAGDSKVRSEVKARTFGADHAADLVGYTVGELSLDGSQSFKLVLNGFKNTNLPAVIDCSFDPDSDSYISKVLNTDPTKIEECGHYLHAHWDIDKTVAVPANDGLKHNNSLISASTTDNGNYANMASFLVAGAGGRVTSAAGKPDYETFRSRFRTAKTPWIVSQFFGSDGDGSARPLTAAAGEAKKLFRLHALDDGQVGNTQFRLMVSNLRYVSDKDFGSFDLTLEQFDSNPVDGEALITWKNANLDVNSRNFIGRLIGDMHTYYDFDRDEGKQRLKVEGSYELKNNLVRIELSDELKQGLIPVEALPAGFQGLSHLFTNSAGNFVEPGTLAANRVFTDGNNAVTETLSKAEVLPIDYVSSISRKEASVEKAESDLAWGVKLAYRESKEEDRKELSEQVFNHSVKSWTKFFPTSGSNPAWIDTDSADDNQNSFFSLEKILIPSSSLSNGVSKAMTSWDGTLYKKASVAPITGERFVNISKDAKGSNVKYLKFRCLFQGGFDGVNIFDKEKADLTSVASLREGLDETESQKFTGPTIMSYRRAVDVLSDKSATEFQLLAIPGQRTSQITDYAITSCEDRFDALLVMDLAEKSASNEFIEASTSRAHVRNTISDFESRVLDTSFAAAYFPDIVIRRPSDNAPLVVPPSVGMMGVMSRNDSIADPWFAPAGLNRGRLSAVSTQVQMNRDLLDELYDADINPVYVPAGRSGEVYAFGQKTLLQDASALDRINVRRLLIDIRRKVKKVGEQLLFEPNRSSTLSRFSALVEPIMANVQQRRGVERYKVQIDTTTTTQNDIENNTIRGKIYLQPTKSVEFISLDFVVANNIQ